MSYKIKKYFTCLLLKIPLKKSLKFYNRNESYQDVLVQKSTQKRLSAENDGFE